MKRFRNIVLKHYKQSGRDLPWRRRVTPYRVFVSEVMLQQTQVERVIPKFRTFVQKFPSFAALARAETRDVLALWQGLGYNRRALALKRASEIITKQHNGRLPRDIETLVTLPGIGKNTAGALLAFAHNLPIVFIETNIRTVFIHHFFAGKTGVRDEDILPLIEKTLDRENPRQWYSALMDYGTHLKKTFTNPSRKSAHHTRQSAFVGSKRQVRGAIVRALSETKKALPKERLTDIVGETKYDIPAVLGELEREGFLREKNGKIALV